MLNRQIVASKTQRPLPLQREVQDVDVDVVFESWCSAHAIDPVNCPIGPVLEFLQERLVAGAAATTFYAVVNGACRELDEVPLWRHDMVLAFVCGV